MKIAIGADHRGFAHKEYIKKHYSDFHWIDVGAYNDDRTDYPIYAHHVAQLVVAGNAHSGVLLCSTGIGMAVVANRYSSIYAAVVWSNDLVRKAKEEDNSNVLVIPSDYVSPENSIFFIDMWINTLFKGGRYAQRLEMIDLLCKEGKQNRN